MYLSLSIYIHLNLSKCIFEEKCRWVLDTYIKIFEILLSINEEMTPKLPLHARIHVEFRLPTH